MRIATQLCVTHNYVLHYSFRFAVTHEYVQLVREHQWSVVPIGSKVVVVASEIVAVVRDIVAVVREIVAAVNE